MKKTLTTDEVAKLRALAERRQELARDIAAIDDECVRLLGMARGTRKSSRQMLDREARERLIFGRAKK